MLAINSALARQSVVTEVFGCIKRHMKTPQQQAVIRSMISSSNTLIPRNNPVCDFLCRVCKAGCSLGEKLYDTGILGAALAICVPGAVLTLGVSCVVPGSAATVGLAVSSDFEAKCEADC